MVKVPARYINRSIEGRCHCQSEAGRLLCYAGDILEEFDKPSMKVVLNDDNSPCTPEDLADEFGLWLGQFALDLSWADPIISFRAQVEDWSRGLILKTLRLRGATKL